ncbi:hypothetical protein [Thermoactinospora rubra]|uniref:hypothetical protein n=1 Tax=Thermoactinospora rubra TaxID=1088767 RepID=UPI00117D4387|nr:hypothetical protein [Thermoactinospora rubra]
MRALLLMAAAVLVTGCGADTTAPVRTAEQFYRALSGGQADAACRLLAPRTAEKLPEESEGCGQALEKKKQQLQGGSVESAEVWGDEARVVLSGDVVFLHHYPDGWRVKAVGCRPRAGQPYDCEVES